MQFVSKWLRACDGVSMYRVTSISLGVLSAVAIVVALVSPAALLYNAAGLAVSVILSAGSAVLFSWAFGKFMHRPAHLESALITGLILSFLMPAEISAKSIMSIVFANLAAAASKWVITFRSRHIFNPAAIGAVLMTLLSAFGLPILPSVWWVGSSTLFPAVVIVALIISYRMRSVLRTFGVWVVFTAVSALPLLITGGTAQLVATLPTMVVSSPLLFLAAVMLTEPLTSGSGYKRYIGLTATAVALWLPAVFSVYLPTELAVLVGNLVMFLLCFKQVAGTSIALTGHEMLTPTIAKLEFSTSRPAIFEPGQYVELDLPHHADVRGRRRIFSVASAPGHDHFDVLMRVPQRHSSFKQAILDNPSKIWSTGFSGNFTLPKDKQHPLLLVAHGIGITPFMSQIFSYRDRDITLVWQVSDPSDLIVPSFPGARVIVIVPSTSARVVSQLPVAWEVTSKSLEDVISGLGDAPRRSCYASGSPRFIRTARRSLASAGVARVHTDSFTGY